MNALIFEFLTYPTITVPTWLISLLVPLFVTVLIAIITNIKVVAKQNGRFDTCIENLSERVQMIHNRLDRVETKLDNYILKNIE